MPDARISDERLLGRFREFCLRQFPVDLRDGDACVASADVQALRRIAHNLKSVMSTLGEDVAAASAGRLEELLATQDWSASTSEWRTLRRSLLDLTR